MGFTHNGPYIRDWGEIKKEKNLLLMISDKICFQHLPLLLAGEYSFHLMSAKKKKSLIRLLRVLYSYYGCYYERYCNTLSNYIFFVHNGEKRPAFFWLNY